MYLRYTIRFSSTHAEVNKATIAIEFSKRDPPGPLMLSSLLTSPDRSAARLGEDEGLIYYWLRAKSRSIHPQPKCLCNCEGGR